MKVPRTVGTGGRVEWMRGPCACPRPGEIRWLHEIPTKSYGEQDRHKAPTHLHIHPLSLHEGCEEDALHVTIVLCSPCKLCDCIPTIATAGGSHPLRMREDGYAAAGCITIFS